MKEIKKAGILVILQVIHYLVDTCKNGEIHMKVRRQMGQPKAAEEEAVTHAVLVYAVVVEVQDQTYTWATDETFVTPEATLAEIALSFPPAQSRHIKLFLVGMAPDEARFFGYQGPFTFSSWQQLTIVNESWVPGTDQGTKRKIKIMYVEE